MYSWIWLFLQPVGRLVDRHHDLRAVPHDRRHQRRVLGADLVVVEVLQLGEAHHVGVEVDPVVELALLDVADDVVDRRRGRRRGRSVGFGRLSVGVAGLEHRRRGSGCGRRTCAPSRRTRRPGRARASPCSSVSTHGSRTLRAPRATAASYAASASSTSQARSCTPSPWRAHVLGDRRVGVERAGDDEADRRPARARSSPCRGTPVSGPAYAVQWKPNADMRNPAVVRALPTQNSMQSQPRRCWAGDGDDGCVSTVVVASMCLPNRESGGAGQHVRSVLRTLLSSHVEWSQQFVASAP